ncbi:MAG: alcohol dehydrogenase catalytic domain-containing protein, partial [Rhodospirillales bacterium]|nr:alcohol dehydrogenase catalytic domain-containing protein [Rhodospirillales bacterium]
MNQVLIEQFGDPDVLELREVETPQPGPGQVVVRLTSIGMNHAELLGRKGGYKASTGEPPFVPGIEGGGIVEAIGDDVENLPLGQRVSLGPNLPRAVDGPHGGTYRTHMLVDANVALPAPDAIPDEQLGAIWLAYLTAWGCLVWKHGIQEGDRVGIPAASS